jgi:murein DD-endopeptidase MepM/ murein hydrolase activator NlpD
MSKAVQSTNNVRDLLLSLIPRRHLLAVLLLLAALVLVIALVPDEAVKERQNLVTTPLPIQDVLPEITANIEAIAEPEVIATLEPQEPVGPQWQEYQIQSGDNLSILFRRAGLNDKDIYELTNKAPEAKNLRRIQPGQGMSFLVENGKLLGLKHNINRLDSIHFTRQENNKFSAEKISVKPESRLTFHQAVITSSLFMAGKRAGIPNSLTMDMANIFGWDIDFALDIQKGDSFKVMYEELYLDGEMIGTGKILAAEFTNTGKTYKAVRYTDKEGHTSYYTPEGKGMHKAFLRSPIEFARISSHFNLARKHPVLHVIRAHKGTDYAAARGTPIRATGNGKISFAGVKGGYGNCIIIQHGQGIQTLYGHMSAFGKGMRTGTKVSQGDVIGYVGATGLASGPHLHYEFHVNGQVRNPVTVPLPKAAGIPANEMASFTATVQPLLAKLDELGASRLAMRDEPSPSVH